MSGDLVHTHGRWPRHVSRAIIVGCCAAAAILLGGAGRPARADDDPAPDVVVLCEPTLQHTITDLGILWRKQTGVPVRVLASPTWALLEQISHGISGDVVVGEGDAAAGKAVERKLIQSQTLERLWRNQLVAAATESARSKSAEVTLATLAGKAPIALVDGATALAGADSMKALIALGLWDSVRGKSIGVVDTADGSYLLAEGKVRLALLYATDVAANPSFLIADRLPVESYPPITYWAAQTHEAASPNTGRFLDFLRQPPAQEQARRDGLEILP
jgi:molybdate transport system substrate-binding protein